MPWDVPVIDTVEPSQLCPCYDMLDTILTVCCCLSLRAYAQLQPDQLPCGESIKFVSIPFSINLHKSQAPLFKLGFGLYDNNNYNTINISYELAPVITATSSITVTIIVIGLLEGVVYWFNNTADTHGRRR